MNSTRATRTSRAARALVIVDVQNDFVEGGALAVAGGREVASRISSYLALHAEEYAVVAASRDWHDPGSDNGGHLALNGPPDFVDSWPVHCLAHDRGSDYAPGLALRHVTHHVKKGMGRPAYSAFEGVADDGRGLAEVLRDARVTAIDVCGLATDHCVRATALDAARLGLAVRLLPGLHAGVAAETTKEALRTMTEHGVVVGVVVGIAEREASDARRP